MKRIALSLFPMLLLLLTGFTSSGDRPAASGKYGLQGVQLELHPDGTFEFVHADVDQHATGTWTVDGKRVKLTTTAGSTGIPTNWKLDGDCPCIRSEMKKLEILRLCQDH